MTSPCKCHRKGIMHIKNPINENAENRWLGGNPMAADVWEARTKEERSLKEG